MFDLDHSDHTLCDFSTHMDYDVTHRHYDLHMVMQLTLAMEELFSALSLFVKHFV